MGWLHSTPKSDKEVKISRADKLRIEQVELEALLPKCQAEHLVLLFYESGIREVGFNGYTPLTYQSVVFWQIAQERDLELWEKQAIMDMSREYVMNYNRGCNENEYSKPPYKSEEYVAKVEAPGLKDFFETQL